MKAKKVNNILNEFDRRDDLQAEMGIGIYAKYKDMSLDDQYDHLIEAVSDENMKLVKELLAAGIDVHCHMENYDKWGGLYNKPLVTAVLSENIEMVKFLVSKNTISLPAGVDVNDDFEYYSDLSVNYAAENGNLEIVELLLDNGGNVHGGFNEDGEYPLREAAKNGHTEVVQLLLDKGSYLEGGYPQDTIEQVALKGHYDIVKILLEKGYLKEEGISDAQVATILEAGQKKIHDLIVSYF